MKRVLTVMAQCRPLVSITSIYHKDLRSFDFCVLISIIS